MIKYELRFDNEEIKKSLSNSAKKHIRETVAINLSPLKEAIKKRYAVHVRKTPEYINLTRSNALFRTEVGVPNANETLKSIVDILLDNIEVKVNRGSNEGLDYMIPLTIVLFDERILKILLSSPEAEYISESEKRHTVLSVPWLQWLLLSGSEPVVFGFRVMYNKQDWSRTNNAIMVPSNSEDFSIQERFSGTKEDNFLTRAATELADELPEIIIKEVIGKL